MYNIIKNHPLKPIDLYFYENKEAPEFELEALLKYEKAHDDLWRLKMHFERQKGELQLLLIRIQNLEREQQKLDKELDFIKSVLDSGADPETDAQLDMAIYNWFLAMRAHNEQLFTLHQGMDESLGHYQQDLAKLHEEDMLIDPENFELLRPLYQRYEEVQVYTISLDKDHQLFLEAYGKVDKLFQAYYEQFDLVYDRYMELKYAADMLCEKAEEVHERLGEV